VKLPRAYCHSLNSNFSTASSAASAHIKPLKLWYERPLEKPTPINMGEITFNDPVKFDTSMDAIKPRRRENLLKINSTTTPFQYRSEKKEKITEDIVFIF
jgi:hypothetical protein